MNKKTNTVKMLKANRKCAAFMGIAFFGIFLGSCSKSDVSADAKSTEITQLKAAPAGSPVAKYGQIKVSGRYLQSSSGSNIMLRGQSFGWSTWWPKYWNANVVSWLASDWKADVVRASMGVDQTPGYLNDQTNQTNLVKTVVNGAVSSGIYVIIDWHCEAFYQSQAVAFFKSMAQTYGNNPNVIYEILNEPNNTQTWAQVKSYAQAVIAGIRQYDPDNIIVVGCPNWDQKIRDVADSPITGYSNIMYTVHFYAATHGQWLRDDCTYAYNKGIPIFITECCGTEASGSGSFNYTEWNAWWNFCDAQKISWINWSVSDVAGQLCSILQPNAPTNGGWNTSQLTESGNYVRNKLRSYSSTGNTGITSGATYSIKAVHSGKVLDIAGASTADGAILQQYTNYNSNNQKFIITDVGSGYYKVSPVSSSGKAIDVYNNSTADGGSIVQWTYGGGSNQQWQFVANGNNYNIKSRLSGKCLDVSGASTADGATVVLWTCGSGTNQEFTLTKL
jgi:endoglucanase